MRTIQKIMVPLDFSPRGEEVLDFAIDLSRQYDAALAVVHVNELPPNLLPSGALPPNLVESWLADVNALLGNAETRAVAAGVRHVETELLQGVPHVEIVRGAREDGVDLIVMGTHGRTGVKHALIGSVAERVVRKAPCPVLTVRVAEQNPAGKPAFER